MRILFVSSECTPFASTGGLSDVSAALPDALNQAGHQVDRIMPYYKSVDRPKLEAKSTGHHFSIHMGEDIEEGSVWQSSIGKTPTYFIRCDEYFYRDGLYGDHHGEFGDNERRYCFFQKAVVDFILSRDYHYDVVHLNDWQTGLLPFMIKDTLGEGAPKTLFTVHNLAYQGSFDFATFPLTGLEPYRMGVDGIEFYGRINFMKAGLQGADYISTVSARYAEEIQTPEFGCGMEGLLQFRSDHLEGIVNGVDYSTWDPSKDSHIRENYSPSNLAGKTECKKDLLERCGLEYNENSMTLGMVSRMTDQKGFDLLADAMESLMVHDDLQLVILGSGEIEYENMAKEWAEHWPDRVSTEIGFNIRRSHQIEAGIDAFLMPSKFEPCGLNQLYSLKYGTLSIVSPVGGLYDTVKPIQDQGESGTGFVMESIDSEALAQQVETALKLYQKPEQWQRVQKRGMNEDWSWNKSVVKYEALYNRMCRK